MKRMLGVLALLLLAASSASAKSIKVFVYAAVPPVVSRDGFTDVPPPNPGADDSVNDIKRVLRQTTGVTPEKRKEEAAILLRVVSREEVKGHYLVHAMGRFQEHDFELTGSSVHTWKQSAEQIVDQLKEWTKANKSHFK